MKLSEILQEDLVLLQFESSDKWDAIEKMVDNMIETGRLDRSKRTPVLEALFARERVSSTAVDHAIALPHASTDAIDEPLFTIAVSTKGVPFQSRDGSLSKIIVLLVIPKLKAPIHMKTLAAVASILNCEATRMALLNAKRASDVLSIIKKEEEKV